MKTRNGFVSNSSSCSFVLIGYEVPKEEINLHSLYRFLFEAKPQYPEADDQDDFEDMMYEGIMDKLDDLDLFYSNNTDMGSPKDGICIFGVQLALLGSEDPELHYTSNSLDGELIERVKNIGKNFGINEEPKIITGSRLC